METQNKANALKVYFIRVEKKSLNVMEAWRNIVAKPLRPLMMFGCRQLT